MNGSCHILRRSPYKNKRNVHNRNAKNGYKIFIFNFFVKWLVLQYPPTTCNVHAALTSVIIWRLLNNVAVFL